MRKSHENWLLKAGERADALLNSMPIEHLGSAGRILMGIKEEACPTCNGKGTITIDPRENNG